MATFAVLGIPRSGTSLVSGILHTLGIHMGDDLLPGDEWNPDGYFADLGFLRVLDEFSCDELTLIVDNDRLIDADFALIEYIRSRSDVPHWAVNDHRLGLVLDRFTRFCEQPVAIITTVRPFDDSVSSLMARSGRERADIQAFLGAIQSYQREALGTWSGRRLVVDFYALLAQPRLGVLRINEFTGVQASPEAIEQAIRLVKPHYRRF